MANHADDLERLVVHQTEIQPLPYRVLIAEKFLHEIFVNDADPRRIGVILRGEEAPAKKRNFHDFEVIRADAIPQGIGHADFVWRLRLAFAPKDQSRLAVQGLCAGRQGNGADARTEAILSVNCRRLARIVLASALLMDGGKPTRNESTL